MFFRSPRESRDNRRALKRTIFLFFFCKSGEANRLYRGCRKRSRHERRCRRGFVDVTSALLWFLFRPQYFEARRLLVFFSFFFDGHYVVAVDKCPVVQFVFDYRARSVLIRFFYPPLFLSNWVILEELITSSAIRCAAIRVMCESELLERENARTLFFFANWIFFSRKLSIDETQPVFRLFSPTHVENRVISRHFALPPTPRMLYKNLWKKQIKTSDVSLLYREKKKRWKTRNSPKTQSKVFDDETFFCRRRKKRAKRISVLACDVSLYRPDTPPPIPLIITSIDDHLYIFTQCCLYI